MSAANSNFNPATDTDSGVPPEAPEAHQQAGAKGNDGDGNDGGVSVFDCGLTATYSPDDNKLRLYSLTRLGRETFDRVKAAGFKWAPKQDLFVAPMWTPAREDLLLELAGEIDDEDTSLVDRAGMRAERFGQYSDKREGEAQAARRAVSAIADHIPLGQPILVGHHSERHARKDAQRIEDGMRRAVRLWETSEYWSHRAAGALRAAKYKERADVRHRRIKGLEADKRKHERTAKEAQTYLAGWQVEGLTMERAMALANGSYMSRCFPLTDFPRDPPASQYEGPMGLWSALDGGVITVEQAREICLRTYAATIAHAQRWIDHYGNRLAYERAMLDEQGGIAADRFDIQPGGRVLVSGEWVVVMRVTRREGKVCSLKVNRRFVSVVGIEEVKDYQAPSAVKAATKLPPLTNYPGEGVLQITQAQWDKVYKDHKGTAVVKATETTGAHRRRQVDNFVARSLGHECARSSQWGSTFVFIADAKRVDPPAKPSEPAPKVRDGEQSAAAPTPAGAADVPCGPDQPVASLPVPQRVESRPVYRPKAPTEFDAMREQLRLGVQVVAAPQLFPTPPELAARMVDLAGIEIGQRVLEPSSGTLRLLQALPGVAPFGERRQTALDVVAVEVDRQLAELARCSGLAGTVHCRDFLEVTPDELGGRFDAVLMNPPFANAVDIAHIEHAARFLKPGGTLVAICAAGPRQHQRLQPLVAHRRGTWEPLPEGTFEESGAGVRTVLLSFTVGEHTQLERLSRAGGVAEHLTP
jgi:SAM-dependent methyltransferase